MTVWALGLNHKTTPLDVRGRFAFAPDELTHALEQLRQRLQQAGAQAHAAILSTCNRTEIYGSGDSPAALAGATEWFAQRGGMKQEALARHSYQWQGADAARHAFRVASGLDSMVLGETQVLGQLKDAVRAAAEAGHLGSTLHQLFQRSFAVAKAVRSQTEIGQASISMPAAAVRLAEQLFEDLSRTRMLFVGAGEMVELASTHFAAQAPLGVVIANRTEARSAQLAAKLNEARSAVLGKTQVAFAQTMALADLPARLHEFDVVVSCTASTLPIIGLGAVERAIKLRKRQPMFMVDLAVPRDIEPQVQRLGDVYLYTVDDLATLVQEGKASRQAAVTKAQTIVDDGVAQFERWMQRREALPLIERLNAQADAWRSAELARARKSLDAGRSVEAVLEQLSQGLVQKTLHGSFAALGSADVKERQAAALAIEQLLLAKSDSAL